MTIDEQAHLGLAEMVGVANGAPLETPADVHLERCLPCRAEVRSWSMVAAGVRTVMAEAQPPEAVLEAVLAAIGTDGGGSGRPQSAPASPAGQPARRILPGWRPAAAAAVAVAVLGGGGLGIASVLSPGAGTQTPGNRDVATAALTATSCRNLKLVIGTLDSVSGRTLVIRAGIGPAVRVTTSDSTTVTREVTGTLADVHDGMHVIVWGASSHRRIAAERVAVTSSSLGLTTAVPAFPVQRPQPVLLLGIANGTVADVTTSGFSVDERGGTQIRVTTSHSTRVVTLAKVAVTGLRIGERTVAVGSVTGHSTLAASTVEQEDLPLNLIGPVPAPNLPFRPGRLPRFVPGGFPGAGGRPTTLPSGFPRPGGLLKAPPRPAALFFGLGCNAPAIAATGLLAWGS